MPPSKKKLLLLCRHAPYDGQLARAGLDIALAGSVFEQDLSLLFMDEGVWQLLPAQDAQQIDSKNIARTLESLPLYDLDTFYVDQHSMGQRGLLQEQLAGNTRLLAEPELGAFLESFDQIISC